MNKNSVGILLAVLGIGAGILGYFVIFQRFTTQRDELATANAGLQTEVDHLQDLADHKQEYLDETANMKAQDEEIIAQFPAEVRAEDEIMYLKNSENAFGVFVKAISMPESNVVEVARPEPAAVEASSEGAEEAAAEPTEDGEVVEDTSEEAAPAAPQILLYQTPVSCNLNTSYASAKDMINAIVSDKDNKKSFENLALSFDTETGALTGSMTYSMYSLTGTDKTYVEPSVPGVAIGTSDIFNTTQRSIEIAAQKQQAAAAAAASAQAEASAEQ